MSGSTSPGWFEPGGWLSSSGNGLFAPSGTAPTAANPNAIVPGYAADNYTPLPGAVAGVAGASDANLVKALQAGAKIATPAADKALPGAAIPQLAPAGQPMRRVSIDQLAQLLNKRRDDLLAAAMKPGGQVEPYSVPHSLGLLGF
jgi:hypothetical protein